MKTLTFITHNLDFGGVQKSVSALANYLVRDFRVNIILFEKKAHRYELNKDIKFYHLDEIFIKEKSLKRGIDLYNFRVESLKNIVSRMNSDLYISFEEYNSLVTLEAVGQKERVVVSSRVDIESVYKNSLVHLLDYDFYIRKIKKLYPLAKKVVTVAKGIENYMKTVVNVDCETVVNGIDMALIKRLASEKIDDDGFILHVGRFDTRQKGQLDLLEAFSRVKERVLENLLLVGAGRDSDLIEKRVDELGLRGRVKMVGYASNPYKYMKKAAFFVFPSYYEGFPNTLLEVLALGVPAISYDFAPSWREMSEDGTLVKIVKRGDIDSLALAVEGFSLDRSERNVYMEASIRRRDRYGKELFFSRWERVLGSLLKEIEVGMELL